jgi:di/tricarboxylate transporter
MAVLQIIKSLLAAILGVRSQQDAEADFAKIDWRWYVVFGAVIVLIVIGLLVVLVKIIIKV